MLMNSRLYQRYVDVIVPEISERDCLELVGKALKYLTSMSEEGTYLLVQTFISYYN